MHLAVFLMCFCLFTLLNDVIPRLRRPVTTHERHTRALHVPAGDIGCQVLRTCRSSLLQRSSQCTGMWGHHGWDDIVQSEREVTVSAQSQVSSTVPTFRLCTGQLWTASCPQSHLWTTTRFVVSSGDISITKDNLSRINGYTQTLWYFKRRANSVFTSFSFLFVYSCKRDYWRW